MPRAERLVRDRPVREPADRAPLRAEVAGPEASRAVAVAIAVTADAAVVDSTLDSAASAQTLGVSALVGAGLFAVWTAIEWMSGPPEVGEIVGEGVTPIAAGAAP